MMASQITYGELADVLAQLGFVVTTVEDRWRAYRHADSDTLIILANRDWRSPARNLDLVSIRRHLVDNDLIGENEFDALFIGHRRP
jgi:hypothetical protein